MERIGADIGDVTLGLLGLLGATRIRDRYRSTSNSVLAAAPVRLAGDPGAENSVLESAGLRG